MNFIVKHSNGNEFQYTNLMEAMDGFVDNFDVKFKASLVDESNQSALVLITYDPKFDLFVFHMSVSEHEQFFIDKMETKLESLQLLV